MTDTAQFPTQREPRRSVMKSSFAYVGGAKKVSKLFVYMQICGIASIIFSAARLLYTLMVIIFPDRYLQQSTVYENTTIIQIIEALLLAGHMICFLMFLVFLMFISYRFMRNLHTVMDNYPRMSPRWAAFWHIVPLAHLWMPFQGMQQIYHGSVAAAGRPAETRTLLGIWWAIWVCEIVVAWLVRFAERRGWYNIYPDVYLFSYFLGIMLGIAAVMLTLRVCKKILYHQAVFLDRQS